MKNIKPILSLLLSASLLIAVIVCPSFASSLSSSDQSKVNSYKSQKSALDSKIAEQQEKVDALKDDIAEEEEYLSGLRTQITNYQNKIDVLSESIGELEVQKAEIQAVVDKLNEEITTLKKKINHNNMQAADSRHEITDIKESLCDSLADVYVSGETDALSYLFACSDFSDYLIMAEISSNKAKQDEEIIATINEDIEEIDRLNVENEALVEDLNGKVAENEKEIAKLEENEKELNSQKSELEESQSEVQAMEKECVKRIKALDTESATYKKLISQYSSEQDALDDKIDAIISAAQTSSSQTGTGTTGTDKTSGSGSYSYSGSFIWPLQYSDAYISSAYGYRNSPLTGSYSLHGGVDTCCWSGTMNKNVVATAGGTVIYSSFNGYGNCVIVDHGSGFVSLYGHLNSRAVSVGQSVKQGQTIGYAGNTYGAGGYSTGAHLHFEIRVNGTKVNPTNYCSP